MPRPPHSPSIPAASIELQDVPPGRLPRAAARCDAPLLRDCADELEVRNDDDMLPSLAGSLRSVARRRRLAYLVGEHRDGHAGAPAGIGFRSRARV
ncbi:hypothetical protein ACP70R_009668 [Stipagrostis hirtigluma subsp. patula]